MESIKELLIKKHLELAGYEPFEEEDEQCLRNLLSIVGKNRFKKEDIVVGKDTSIGLNGGSGILFTTKAICVNDWTNSTPRLIAQFRDIEHCQIVKDRFLGLDISRIDIHMKSGDVYHMSLCLECFNLEDMQNYIEYAMSLCRDEVVKSVAEHDSAEESDTSNDEGDNDWGHLRR